MHRLIAFVATLVVSTSYAQDRIGPRKSDSAGGAVRALMQPVESVRFDSTPLESVFTWIGEFSGAPVAVRWGTLEDAGLRRDTPITFAAENRRLWRVLWGVMNSTPLPIQEKLAYEAGIDGFLFSTHSDLSRKLVTIVYDVEDWLQPDVDFRAPAIGGPPLTFSFTDFSVPLPIGPRFVEPRDGIPDDWTVQPDAGWTREAGGGGGREIRHHTTVKRVRATPRGDSERTIGVAHEPFPESAGVAPEMKDLLELILNTVEPQSWEINGAGGRATIAPFDNRKIVVRNSLYVHQMIGGFVRDPDLLMAARTPQFAGPPAPRPPPATLQEKSE